MRARVPTFRFCVSEARTFPNEFAEREFALDLGVVSEMSILPEHGTQLGDELVVRVRVIPSQTVQLV